MSTTVKKLVRATLTTSNSTQYTTPSSTSAVATSIILSNITSADTTVTLSLGGVTLLNAVPLTAKDLINMEIKQVLYAGETITASAGTNSTVTLFVSGVEVS